MEQIFSLLTPKDIIHNFYGQNDEIYLITKFPFLRYTITRIILRNKKVHIQYVDDNGEMYRYNFDISIDLREFIKLKFEV